MNSFNTMSLITNPELLQGWSLSCSPADSSMTDEYNAQSKFQLTRCAAPFSGKTGARIWLGATIVEVFNRACLDIGGEIAPVPQPIQTTGEELLNECAEVFDSLHKLIQASPHVHDQIQETNRKIKQFLKQD